MVRFAKMEAEGELCISECGVKVFAHVTCWQKLGKTDVNAGKVTSPATFSQPVSPGMLFQQSPLGAPPLDERFPVCLWSYTAG